MQLLDELYVKKLKLQDTIFFQKKAWYERTEYTMHLSSGSNIQEMISKDKYIKVPLYLSQEIKISKLYLSHTALDCVISFTVAYSSTIAFKST